MNFSVDFIEKILQAADILSVLSDRGIQLKRSGANYKALCPFHNEKTPSFTVNPQRGFFYCFGCGKKGDAIHFVREYDKLSFVDSVTELANRFGIPLEKSSSTKTKSEDRILQALRAASKFYHSLILQQSTVNPGREYLKKRAIPANSWQTFQLGFVPEEWQILFLHLSQQGFTQKELLEAGLIKCSQKSGLPFDTFRNRVIFPIRDIQGRCIAFGARALDKEQQPKYLNSAESKYYHKSQTLYGFFEGKEVIKQKRQIILVEGYLDVIRLHECGFKHAVATCGTSLTAEHLRFAQRYSDKILLLLDGDQAGKEAAWRSCPLLLSSKMDATIVVLPPEEDPDSFLLKHGTEKFSKLLQQDIPVFEYLVQQCLDKHDRHVQGRIKAIEELLPLIVAIQDEMIRNLAISYLAESTHISEKDILKRAENTLYNLKQRGRIKSLNSDIPKATEDQDEKRILQVLLHLRAPMAFVREYLHVIEFRTPLFRHIYEQLLQFSIEEFQKIRIEELERWFPEHFVQLMELYMEELPQDLEMATQEVRELELKRWIRRVKERHLKAKYDEKDTTLKTDEERFEAGREFRKQKEALTQFLPQR